MNIPPKSLKQQLKKGVSEPSLAPLSNAGPGTSSPKPAAVPTMRNKSTRLAAAKDVNTESLPVLKAFQDFLDTERRHSRRQVAAVTSFFLILFLAVAGAGAFLGYVYFEKTSNEIDFLHGELERFKSSLQQDTAAMLAGLSDRTEELSAKIGNGDELIANATAQISRSVSNSVTAGQAEMEIVREALRSLQQENMDLRKDLVFIKARQDRMTPATASAAVTATADRPAAVQSTNMIPYRVADTNTEPIEIAILAPGSSVMLKWRIPIWE